MLKKLKDKPIKIPATALVFLCYNSKMNEERLLELKKQLEEINKAQSEIRGMPPEERKTFGIQLNDQRGKILAEITQLKEASEETPLEEIDLTAPIGINKTAESKKFGTKHPIISELYNILDIYARMGFDIVESRQLDDEFHMFDSLNFPIGHPARDGYDTFRTAEGFIPPAHTSTMQYRILNEYKDRLKNGEQIAAVMPGRVFRNEDVDATHEHTFYQCEGIFVSKKASLANMLAILVRFFEKYYGEKIEFKTQPGYFPFTEPSLEFLIKKPEGLAGKGDGWLEMLGCGMIHPNVLKKAGIDPNEYRGFAWGGGIERLVMLKYKINDIRYFESGKLDFLTNGDFI